MTSAQIVQVLKVLYPTALQGNDYTLTVDSSGNAAIALWSTTLGTPPGTPPTPAALQAALDSQTLSQAVAAQTATIMAAYNANRYGAPVSISNGTSTLTFPTDALTQQNIAYLLVAFGLPNAVAAPSAGMPLEDSSGNVQMLTVPQLQQLAGAIANQSITAWLTLKNLLAQVNAATTVAAVQAVVWPSS